MGTGRVRGNEGKKKIGSAFFFFFFRRRWRWSFSGRPRGEKKSARKGKKTKLPETRTPSVDPSRPFSPPLPRCDASFAKRSFSWNKKKGECFPSDVLLPVEKKRKSREREDVGDFFFARKKRDKVGVTFSRCVRVFPRPPFSLFPPSFPFSLTSIKTVSLFIIKKQQEASSARGGTREGGWEQEQQQAPPASASASALAEGGLAACCRRRCRRSRPLPRSTAEAPRTTPTRRPASRTSTHCGSTPAEGNGGYFERGKKSREAHRSDWGGVTEKQKNGLAEVFFSWLKFGSTFFFLEQRLSLTRRKKTLLFFLFPLTLPPLFFPLSFLFFSLHPKTNPIAATSSSKTSRPVTCSSR